VALAVRCVSDGFLGASLRPYGRADWQVGRKRIGVHRADTSSCLVCGATHLLCPAKQHSSVTYLMTVHLLHRSFGVVGEKIRDVWKYIVVAYLGVHIAIGIATGLPGFGSRFLYGVYLS
jgi:hypothetical protein